MLCLYLSDLDDRTYSYVKLHKSLKIMKKKNSIINLIDAGYQEYLIVVIKKQVYVCYF
jgi:hypothetical protein